MLNDNIKNKLKSLPKSPGVYQFVNKNKEILYIGKAKNLFARVKQYFNGTDERSQIPFLMKEVIDFNYIVVNTELESLYLERTLIQTHKPKYNIDLRDDKNYAFLVFDYTTQIPQIVIKRKITPPTPFHSASSGHALEKKGKISAPTTYNLKPTTYFGPYTSTKKIRDLIFSIRKIFGLCSAQKIGKPCFYFHLHRCPGICMGKITKEQYQEHLNKIKAFLTGHVQALLKHTQTAMLQMAKAKKFETAIRLRNQLKALTMLTEKQNMILKKPVSWDIVALAFEQNFFCINLFKIRQGKMMGKENFIYNSPLPPSLSANQAGLAKACPELAEWKGAEGVLQQFLENYYAETSDLPKEICLPFKAPNQNLIFQLINHRFKKTVQIKLPQKGVAKHLLTLGQTNAKEYLKNYLLSQASQIDKTQTALTELQTLLHLPTLPKRIEGFDISNIQGTNAVGSMVVFQDGLPKKSEYRKFKIQGKDTPDDFEMLKEMLSRRLNRIMSKDKWPLPDLIVIDGGKGQLNAVVEVLTTYNLQLTIPVIGLAKRIEEIFLPHQPKPIILTHDQPALQLLQRLRDEAHRFGITFHRALRSKQAVKSALDDISGIGPKTKKLLKTQFGTIANIKNANVDELTKVVGQKLAQNIKLNL